LLSYQLGVFGLRVPQLARPTEDAEGFRGGRSPDGDALLAALL
jgi:hypothetical protein